MAELTYFIAPWDREELEEQGWTPAEPDVHTLRYGYNLADLHRLARLSMRRVFGGSIDYHTRYEVAWSAIAEALYAADGPPEPGVLIAAGQGAIGTHLAAEIHHQGYDRDHPGQVRPRYATYWFGLKPYTSSPEPRIVEVTALWQIWPRLTKGDRQVLLALAAHDDHQAAAKALGLTPSGYRNKLSRARRAFLALWHEGERQSRPWGADLRITAADSDRKRRRPPVTSVVTRRSGRKSREIVHGKPTTYADHGCRCTPCTRAHTAKNQRSAWARGVKPRRRVTVSQLADIRRRHAAGETLNAIAADLGFSGSYLSRLLRGVCRPVPSTDEAAA